VRDQHLPARGTAAPHLRLLPVPAGRRQQARDDDRGGAVQHAHLDRLNPALGRTPAAAAERGDRVVPDEQAGRVAPQGVRAVGEQGVQYGHVVRHQRRLVAPERLEQPRRHLAVRAHGRGVVDHVKSAIRMRACTPLTRSTTWEMSKSVAADR
jgi:hypothetical protein